LQLQVKACNGPIFQSFLQAGFECSTHWTKSGRRLDLISSTQHDRFLDKDYASLAPFGIRTVREGFRWHLIEDASGKLDFSSVMPFIRTAKTHGIEVLWDLLHFGWPDHHDIFAAEWVDAFERFAVAAAELFRSEGELRPFIAPVNEISFLSWAGGDKAYINPHQKGRGGEMKAQLVRAWVRSVHAMRKVLPDLRLVSPEPVIHIVGSAAIPGDVQRAEEYRVAMFEAWDMILGRVHKDLGGSEDCIDVIGTNFYDRNEWWNFGPTIHRGDPDYRPFHQILTEVYERYKRPVFVAETGTEAEARPSWFAYIAEEVATALRHGIPVEGLCLYPILNHPGWEDDRHCPNGLFDYAGESGEREVYKPLADEILKQTKGTPWQRH
jgi:hypothetical protein